MKLKIPRIKDIQSVVIETSLGKAFMDRKSAIKIRNMIKAINKPKIEIFIRRNK